MDRTEYTSLETGSTHRSKIWVQITPTERNKKSLLHLKLKKENKETHTGLNKQKQKRKLLRVGDRRKPPRSSDFVRRMGGWVHYPTGNRTHQGR